MNAIAQTIFDHAKNDNDDLATILKQETDIRLRLVWKYHQYLNWRIMSCVSAGNYTEAHKHQKELRRSILATMRFIKMHVIFIVFLH